MLGCEQEGWSVMSRRYSEEFKSEAVRLYRESGKGYRTLASELGVSGYAIRKWVLEDEQRQDPVAMRESEELKRLRRENRLLREEREILRKAAAFFAREDQRIR